jgi:two pore calcium channel protein
MAVEVAKRITARQGNLRAAFSLLDIRHQEWIDGATMIALFLAIGRYRCVISFKRCCDYHYRSFKVTIMEV